MEIRNLTSFLFEDVFFIFQLVWALIWILALCFLPRLRSSGAVLAFYLLTPFIFLPCALISMELKELLYFQSVLETRNNDMVYDNLALWRFTGIVTYVLSGILFGVYACRIKTGANTAE